ncbi:MAG: enoyl-CoA hydratase/isomerase family protein [bacterium]|nr:enoyl-CoA hydratase/isomerase family protein [bacterium]
MENVPVLFDIKERIGIITLNRPENRNSMDREMLIAFKETLTLVRENRELRCLVITGSGSSFCAGADFKGDIMSPGEIPKNELFMKAYGYFLDVGKLPIPTIGALNGHAIGGGLGLALMCDIRVANKSAKYGANFARLGLHSGMAISYILPRLAGLPRANELLFTGRIITGETAAEFGLVNYAVDADMVLEKSLELAGEIAACAPLAVRLLKSSVYQGLNWEAEKAAELESHLQAQTFDTDDAREGISALLQKRVPEFKGK